MQPISQPKKNIEVDNISIKEFRKISNRKASNAQIFQVRSNDLCSNTGFASKKDLLNFDHGKLQEILHNFEDIFQEELPSGLPPVREVDHEIITDDSVKPPHRPLYQLSPLELSSMKNYVQDLLNKGKIRPSKSTYGAPFFFVKDNGKPLRAVVDYRGLNRITKRNNAPLPRSDEMFDMLEMQDCSRKWILRQVSIKYE